jgi:hypothetical protein
MKLRRLGRLLLTAGWLATVALPAVHSSCAMHAAHESHESHESVHAGLSASGNHVAHDHEHLADSTNPLPTEAPPAPPCDCGAACAPGGVALLAAFTIRNVGERTIVQTLPAPRDLAPVASRTPYLLPYSTAPPAILS